MAERGQAQSACERPELGLRGTSGWPKVRPLFRVGVLERRPFANGPTTPTSARERKTGSGERSSREECRLLGPYCSGGLLNERSLLASQCLAAAGQLPARFSIFRLCLLTLSIVRCSAESRHLHANPRMTAMSQLQTLHRNLDLPVLKELGHPETAKKTPKSPWMTANAADQVQRGDHITLQISCENLARRV